MHKIRNTLENYNSLRYFFPRKRKLVNLVFSKHQTKATHTVVYGAYDAKRAGGEIAVAFNIQKSLNKSAFYI